MGVGGAALASAGVIKAPVFAPDQIQPASLDLRLGAVAYRVRASFLPGSGFCVAVRCQRQMRLRRRNQRPKIRQAVGIDNPQR